MKTLAYRLGRTIADCYKGRNLAWQIAAAALTYIIVESGFDWTYFEGTRSIPFGVVLPAVVLGGLVPIIAPLALIARGAIRKSRVATVTGFALGQAALLGLAISSLYKSFTGRIPPPMTTLVDTSRHFQFGFLRGGVFWGWPSSHTTVAFALGAALFALFPNKKIVRSIGLVWALYVGLGVSVSIHWLSEFAAGAIIGTVIGLTVGKSFRHLLDVRNS